MSCSGRRDLARRKLLPGLFRLSVAGLLPDRYRIVGTARRPITSEQFREHARQAVAEFGTSKPAGDAWGAFARALSFGSSQPADTAPLAAAIQRASEQLGGSPRRLFHLAIPPASFEPKVTMLGAAGLGHGARIIIEKPFGSALASARALNQTLRAVFAESQIFRIDHFLGKESVDNILALRFANGLFEQLLENPPPAEPYAPGSWGPEPSLGRLAAPFRWHLPDVGSTA